MSTKPVIILAFANDRDNYLPMITRERKNIYRTLQDFHDKGYIQVHKEESTEVADIFDLFNRFNHRVAIFHYGGHAGGSHLQLETVEGDAQLAHAGGLAQLMGLQKELRVVFLNGCATRKQVDLLLAAGVKSVIATSVPIDDKMATEFSEQFYKALAAQNTIRKSFNTAKAFVASKYGPSKKIDYYSSRAISWSGKPETSTDEFPWGLYHQEDGGDALEWKLPTSVQDAVIIRGPAAPVAGQVQVNTELIQALFKEVARHSPEVGYLMEGYKRSGRMDIRVVRQAVIDSFPAPVGEQLRRLFAGNTIDLQRLRQLVATYKTIIELLCFTTLSQLWEAKYQNPDFTIPEDDLVEFNSFFALNADSYPTYNYIKLMETMARIFKENRIPFFIEELSEFCENLLKKDQFYKAHLFMEEMKRELAENTVGAGEIDSFCQQAEQHLTVILSTLAFFVKYKLITTKNIELIKRRHAPARFRHIRVILDRVTAGVIDEEQVFDTYTDNKSVMLLKDLQDVSQFLSLSPFVIDENALAGNQNSKIFYYNYRDASDGGYYYKFVDNEEELLPVNNKYPRVKEVFDEFKQLFMES